MKCKKCGAEIPEGMFFCGVCGTPVNDAGGVEKVEAEVVGGGESGGAQGGAFSPPRREGGQKSGTVDSAPYLIFSILATLFCFMPTGIPAIVYAARIESAEQRGDHEAALNSAGKSRMWCIISAAVAAVAVIICVLIWLAVVLGVFGIVAAVGAGTAMFS